MTSLFLPRQIEFGIKSIEKLPCIASGIGVNHMFVIIDAFLLSEQFAYDKKIEELALNENINVTFFSNFKGEPSTAHMKLAIAKLNEVEADSVIAIGGGSAIDLAKAVSLFSVNDKINWEQIHKQKRLNRLPLIAIPTTAGTGSEVTKIMVITNSETNIKMNPGHKDLVPDISILDPEITMSLPKHLTAYTGLDALTHAIEAYVSNLASDLTDKYALTAIEIIGRVLPKVYHDGTDIESRKEMLLASCYAGIAFSNASTNLAHAAGRSLGAKFEIPHGLSVALLLPFVMRFGLEASIDSYSTIAVCLGEDKRQNTSVLAEKAIGTVERYNDQFNIWVDGLNYINISNFEKNIPILVEETLGGNGIVTNRIVPTKKDIEKLYHSLLKKLEEVKIGLR
ncbi:iron-containing alcohol dehydrogenase [Virgibacillus sp. W0430]|uniref:iron-containing alcohol dehydrogenase n=1 Tax=Virgibacillus sp. W0430 TaxID=3391580 RepID=UPI003F482694